MPTHIQDGLKISLIISFYNKLDALKLILAALELQTFKDFEVIISDDGSRQEVVDALQLHLSTVNLKVLHVWHEDKGWRKNKILNKSIKASSADYVVFIDGDCIPHPKFLEEHYKLKAQHVVIAGRRANLSEHRSRLLTPQLIHSGYLKAPITWDLIKDALRGKAAQHWENTLRVSNKLLRALFIPNKVRSVVGCNFSLYRSDLLAVNGFDERFVNPSCGEDVDLEVRLRNANCRVKSYKHLITVYHLYHKPLPADGAEWELCNEHKKNGTTYTPYGIEQNRTN